MIKVIIRVLIILFIFCSNSYAKTINIGIDGVTWRDAFGVNGRSEKGLAEGGDTIIIHKGQMIGLDPSDTRYNPICHKNYAYNCTTFPIPSGTPENPTRILGKGWDTGCENPPQIWGTEGVSYLLNLQGSSNIEIQCLDITDHSDCQYNGINSCRKGKSPVGEYGRTGISARDSHNVYLRNVFIHGMAYRAYHVGRISNWIVEDSAIVNNSFAGWDGDIGDDSANTGYIKFIRTIISGNGCGESYPEKERENCYSQAQGGYGDGLGTSMTGGDWYFEDLMVTENVSDGIDLLYWNPVLGGSVTVKGGLFEKNGGNQFKSAFPTTIEGAVIDSWCSWIGEQPHLITNGWSGDCRALGNSIALSSKIPGIKHRLENVLIKGEGDVLIQHQLGDCSMGNNITIIDSELQPGLKQHYHDGNTNLFWAGYSLNSKTYDCSSNSMNLINTQLTVPVPYGQDSSDTETEANNPDESAECTECEQCVPFKAKEIMLVSKFGSIKSENYERMDSGEVLSFYHSRRERTYECKVLGD